MPEGLEARVSIDTLFLSALNDRLQREPLKEIATRLRQRGHNLTYSMMRNIARAHNGSKMRTVPYALYREITGHEPKTLHWTESSATAQRLARWYCFFFDVSGRTFGKMAEAKAQQEGARYSASHIRQSLFVPKNKTIVPELTDVVAALFREASGEPTWPLGEIDAFLTELDSLQPHPQNMMTVTWNTARQVIERLRVLTNKSHYQLTGHRGVALMSGRRRLKSTHFNTLKSELQKREYWLGRLYHALSYAERDTRYANQLAGLPREERNALLQGMDTYGEHAFMNFLFPAYRAIRDAHGFPLEAIQHIVQPPLQGDETRDMRADQRSSAAGHLGNWLGNYKTDVLDANRRNGKADSLSLQQCVTAKERALRYACK